MEVYINNQKITITAPDLLSLLQTEELDNRKGIAVALNNSVIPRQMWPQTLLNDQDKITIIRATQGG